MITEDKVIEIFCIMDEFCNNFASECEKNFSVPVPMCNMAQTPILHEKSQLINVKSLLKSVSLIFAKITIFYHFEGVCTKEFNLLYSGNLLLEHFGNITFVPNI